MAAVVQPEAKTPPGWALSVFPPLSEAKHTSKQSQCRQLAPKEAATQ